MKIQDIETKIVFRCDELYNDGSRIKVYMKRKLIAIVPMSRAKLIFREHEIPFLEESRGAV